MTNKTEHPQAYLFRWIADGEVIERSHITEDNWFYQSTFALLQDMLHDVSCKKYRIKPKTIRIGNYDVAEPMKKPVNNEYIYSVDFSSPYATYRSCLGSETYRVITNSGIFWLNREDAELAAKAIRELLTGTEC